MDNTPTDQAIQPVYNDCRDMLLAATHIVVIQADNPDADSLGSALSLEALLEEQGKEVSLYCGVTIPEYLRYLSGWDRVSQDLPRNFDLSIIVDANTVTLLEKIQTSTQYRQLMTKPTIALDHHATVDEPIAYANLTIVDTDVSSTGELIYVMMRHFGWKIPTDAANHMMTAILGDTQGLSNDLTSPNTYRAMAELTELGASRTSLENARREFSKMSKEIYAYKAHLIQQTQFHFESTIATITIPQSELNQYSAQYNPIALIQNDILQIRQVQLCIIFKKYDDGKITAALRSNYGYPVCGEIAAHFNGGGHDYAAGFKSTDGTPLDVIQKKCFEIAAAAVVAAKGSNHETL